MTPNLCAIGPLLRERREKKGLTIDEVSNALFIKDRVVGALEAGDWSNLPHPVYVKGYVKDYAALLDIPIPVDQGEGAQPEPALSTMAEPTGQHLLIIARLRGFLHHLVGSPV